MKMLLQLVTASIFTLLALLPSQLAGAAVIQVLHTNDLHAALKTAGEPKVGSPEFGGWAQVKTILDRYTEAAKKQGIETLRLDAGDFLEGSLYYFPNNGEDVMRAYMSLGFDASTLGNHDWLMGARDLNKLVQAVPYTHPLVASNIKIHPRLKSLSQQLKPYTVIEKAGVKIGIFGLSTTEAFYKWIPKIGSKKRDFRLLDYLDTEFQDETQIGIANQIAQTLAPKTDAIIAVTHIGFGSDLELIAQSQHLDLVVGGHSHTFLETLNQEKDKDGREVTVVQSGYNGRNIGRVMLEVNPGQPARVLTYELIPVPNETALDPVVAAHVERAEAAVQKTYSSKVLDEPIGTAQVRLVPGKFGPTAFSQFAVDAMRKSIDAEVGIDVGAFHANTPQSGGIVTRRKIMEMYPRKFESKQNEGLYVYRAKIPGLVLALGLKFSVKYGVFTSFSGVDYQVEKLSDAEIARIKKKNKGEDAELLTPYRAKKITVGGNRICLVCTYEVAAPESLVRGAYGISPLVRLIIWGGKRTNQTIWNAMESHLKEIKVIAPVSTDAHFAPRRYSNSYQKQFGGQIDPDQSQPTLLPDTRNFQDQEEPDTLAELQHGRGDEIPTEALLKKFLGEVFRAQNLKALDRNADADQLLDEAL